MFFILNLNKQLRRAYPCVQYVHRTHALLFHRLYLIHIALYKNDRVKLIFAC